jgi:magnesium-transporting ATPase (P-type)
MLSQRPKSDVEPTTDYVDDESAEKVISIEIPQKPKAPEDTTQPTDNSNSSKNWANTILGTSVLFLLLNIAQTVVTILDTNYSPLTQAAKTLTCIVGVGASVLGILGNLHRLPKRTQYAANYIYILILALILVAHIAATVSVVESPIYQTMSHSDYARLIVPLCFTVVLIVALIALIDLRVHIMLRDEKRTIV